MIHHLPDPDLGRCPNYRSDGYARTFRCLRRSDNHAGKECWFDEPPPPVQQAASSVTYRPSPPKPWVEPASLVDRGEQQ